MGNSIRISVPNNNEDPYNLAQNSKIKSIQYMKSNKSDIIEKNDKSNFAYRKDKHIIKSNDLENKDSRINLMNKIKAGIEKSKLTQNTK